MVGRSEHDLKLVAVNSDNEFFDPARENCPSDVVVVGSVYTYCPPFLGWPSNTTARLRTGPLSSELCQKSVGCAHGVALKLGKAVTTAAKVLIYSTVHQSRYLYVLYL